jgi:hypothetical protein
MKTLATARDRAAIHARIESLTQSDQRRWGKMSVHGMVCHLADSFRLCLGEKTASDATGVLQRSLLKWAALRLPVPWARHVSTRPELEQGVGGSLPTDFGADRAELLRLMKRLQAPGAAGRPAHPIFGRMTEAEWMRWGYLHTDHHLRQFGR